MSKKPLKIRDRIKAFKRVKVKELLHNPKNWRGHGDEQREFLQWVFGKVGIADAVLVRETKAGLMLIDGQMRQEELDSLDPEHPMPVLVLDVTAKEADLLLATMDRITGLARRDDDKLDDLMADLELEAEELPSFAASRRGGNIVQHCAYRGRSAISRERPRGYVGTRGMATRSHRRIFWRHCAGVGGQRSNRRRIKPKRIKKRPREEDLASIHLGRFYEIRGNREHWRSQPENLRATHVSLSFQTSTEWGPNLLSRNRF